MKDKKSTPVASFRTSDLSRVVEDLSLILEPTKIGWYVGADDVEFVLDKPRPSLGPKRKIPFKLVMPYRVGGKEDKYLVTPARTAGFGPKAAADIADLSQGSPWRLIREMSRDAAEDLAERFIHRRPGLEKCGIRVGDVRTSLFDRPQPSRSGPRLNGFRIMGELSVARPLTGYAAMAQYGLAEGLYKYIQQQKYETAEF